MGGVLTRPINEWNAQSFDAIVAQGLDESLRLEFKSELSLDTRKQRKEVAKDVCAFANSAGGWLLYGIAERNGPGSGATADKVTPVGPASLAAQFDDVVHASITPPPRLRVRAVEYTSGQYCVVVHVQQSDDAVHQVSAYGDSRYYCRSDFAARPMTEGQVRAAYARVRSRSENSEELISKAREVARLTHRRHYTWVAVIADDTTDAVDPRMLDRDLLRPCVDRDWLSHVRPAAGGLEARVGDHSGSLLTVSRDGSVALVEPVENVLHPGELAFQVWQACALAAALDLRLGVFPGRLFVCQVHAATDITAPGSGPRPAVFNGSAQLRRRVRYDDIALGWFDLVRAALDRVYQHMELLECPHLKEPREIESLVAARIAAT